MMRSEVMRKKLHQQVTPLPDTQSFLTQDGEIRSCEVREKKLHQQVTPPPDTQSLHASLPN